MINKYGLLYDPFSRFNQKKHLLHDGCDEVEANLDGREYALTSDFSDNIKCWRLYGYKKRSLKSRRASRSIEEAMDQAMEKFAHTFGKLHD